MRESGADEWHIRSNTKIVIVIVSCPNALTEGHKSERMHVWGASESLHKREEGTSRTAQIRRAREAQPRMGMTASEAVRWWRLASILPGGKSRADLHAQDILARRMDENGNGIIKHSELTRHVSSSLGKRTFGDAHGEPTCVTRAFACQ